MCMTKTSRNTSAQNKQDRKTSSDQDVTFIPASLLIKTGNKKRHEEEVETEGKEDERL